MERDDVGVLKLRGKPDFAGESFGADARCKVWRENFDYDLATECRFRGEENTGHATATELALERVCRAKCGLKLIAQLESHSEEPDRFMLTGIRAP